MTEQLCQIWRRCAPPFFCYLRKTDGGGTYVPPPGRARVKKEHAVGPLPTFCSNVEKQFKQMHGDIFLSVSAGNNCILFNEQDGAAVVAVIRNFVKTSDGMQVVVQRFQEMESFYSYPLESSRLGIFKVHTYSPTLETLSAQFVQDARKCILAELDATSYVSVPLLHGHCAESHD